MLPVGTIYTCVVLRVQHRLSTLYHTFNNKINVLQQSIDNCHTKVSHLKFIIYVHTQGSSEENLGHGLGGVYDNTIV